MREQIADTVHKITTAADSAATYCAGTGLTWFSCQARELNDIAQLIGVIVGIGVCALKAYYDFWIFREKRRKKNNE